MVYGCPFVFDWGRGRDLTFAFNDVLSQSARLCLCDGYSTVVYCGVGEYLMCMWVGAFGLGSAVFSLRKQTRTDCGSAVLI